MFSSATPSSSSQNLLEEASRLRNEELEVAQSIYENQLSVKDVSNGSLLVEMEMYIELEGQWKVNLIGPLNLSDPTPHTISLELSYLPPVRLTILLPSTYPLQDSAKVVTVHAAHSWLDQASLRAALQTVANENSEGIIWPIFEYVRDGSLLSAPQFDLSSSSRTLNLPHPTPHLLAPLLLSHNTLAANRSFAATSFDCPICLTTIKGLRCIRLEKCGHVACRDCLAQFWTMSIQTGEVEKVGCVDEECVKKAAKADDIIWSGVGEEEVRNVVGEAMLMRWQRLREKRMIERDPTIVRCPIELCQAPVPKPKSTSIAVEGDDERLRVCPSHGPITPCKIVAIEQFLEAYISAEPDSPERLRLERQYGKRQIQKLVVEHNEAKANKAWLEQNTMACPGCRTNVEKTMGCNHMKCGRCSMHFCYKCGVRLNPTNPYSHYSMRNTPCFGNLFNVDPDETAWEPMEGFELI
ncbi:translation termination inhibitor protein itt1 [Tulasnella sp. 427]|nr:translation termination inhibitor protein itt1 [Tulasnella sp. 427]